MKKLGILIIVLVVAVAGLSLTNTASKTSWYNGFQLTGNARDNVLNWAQEVETWLENRDSIVIADSNVTTLTASDSGKTYVSDGIADTNEVYFLLPTAAAGLEFTFVDANATAAKDLWITAAAGDTINGGTAAKSYKCTGDAVKQNVKLKAVDGTRWIVISEVGTWANDDS